MNSSADKLLIVSAIAGLLVYLFLLPGQHPDAVGEMEISADEARQEAASFLNRYGYSIEGLRPGINLLRNDQSITSLQDSLGRRWILNEIPTDAVESMGLFRWAVSFYKKVEGAGWSPAYTVNLTPQGRVFEFSNHDDVYVENSGASLLEILRSNSAVGETLAAINDSLLSQSVEFDQNAFPTGATTIEGFARIEAETGRSSKTIVVEPGGAAFIAKKHLVDLGYPTQLAPDSLWVEASDGGSVAAVRFIDPGSDFSESPSVYVRIFPSGSLESIDTRVLEPDGDASSGDSVSREEIFEIGLGVIPILGVVFFLLVTFFRRIMARLIDVKAALIDGVIVSVLCVIFLILQPNLVFGMSPLPGWARWLVPFAIGGFVGCGVAVMTFILASAADSFARSKLAATMASIGLIRRGQLINGLVGLGLVRGVLAGLALLGLTTLLLFVMPEAGVRVSSETTMRSGYLAIITAVITAAILSYAQIGIFLLTVVALVRRWTSNKLIPIGSGAVLLMSIQVMIPDVFPFGLALLGSLVTGLLMTWLFIQYDLLTSIIALFSASLIWLMQSGWLMDGTPLFSSFLLALLVVTGIFLLGIVGITKGEPVERIRDYVPAYIQELRSQERLQHELNIAQQVQGSFLPKKMPQVDGLDLAARCLVAEEVGGDYYDFVPMGDGKLAVVIGDVSGKGIQAAFFMTLVKGFVRTLCKENLSPAEVVIRVNELFCENAPRGMFISMVFGILDVGSSTFIFARAGHNPILIREADGQKVSAFQPSGLGIGFVKGRQFEKSVQQVTAHLNDGDAIVLYTDGFSEAMNHSRELFGDDRLSSVIRRADAATASHLLDEVQEAVDNFVEGAERHDDMTMIVLKLSSTAKGIALT